LVPKDTHARDVSILVNGVTALLSLVAIVILLMAGSNIAYTFRALLQERKGEIGLYRAVGATRRDIVGWLLTLAGVVGVVYAVIGLGVGWLATRLADWVGHNHLPDFPFKPDSFFSFPMGLTLGVVLFGSLFAVMGALGPTLRVAASSPRDCLLG
jgi:ABC-type antimicrobial peptide transport system permease subunit